MSTLRPFKMRFPATSANLGPGFDAAALAMALYLEVEAAPAAEFSIAATGRNADICGAVKHNLLLTTYSDVLRTQNRPVTPLALKVRNGIPLGMGCGSSAAVILAGVALAAHFGGLGWTPDDVLAEACVREGHPDNAAACWLGGMTVAAMEQGRVHAVSMKPKKAWMLMLALPGKPLATKTARGLLPESYAKQDAIFNVQRVALLTAAFAEGRGELLRVAMQDRMHQPFRMEVCPLLPTLRPLGEPAANGSNTGILGVALSGAGPSVLLLLEEGASEVAVRQRVEQQLSGGFDEVELLVCGIESSGACESISS